MSSIIVTVTNQRREFFYDIEAPCGLAIEKLKDDIVEALKGYNPGLNIQNEHCAVLCNRINRRLAADETFESAGVWNGDYITVVEV